MPLRKLNPASPFSPRRLTPVSMPTVSVVSDSPVAMNTWPVQSTIVSPTAQFADGFTSLIDAPLLLIDDLGTEPMMRNITVEYLFTLLNERALNKRHTVIATNLTPPLLKERYGERIMSRLSDTKAWDHCRLMGKDLRRA